MVDSQSPANLQDLRVECICRLDTKSRLSLPDIIQPVVSQWKGVCRVVKERPGALSLWSPGSSDAAIDSVVAAALAKYDARQNQNLLEELMTLGRLRSTRETTAKLDGRARLTIPQTFREFLGVEPEGNVTVVAATVCIEIWRPEAWIEFVNERIADYRKVSESLLS